MPVRRIDRTTGATEVIDLPCGATLASKCPSCGERARRLRIAQCKEGWRLESEPILAAEPATAEQRSLATVRADLEQARVDTEDAGEDAADVDRVIGQVDELVTESGVRGLRCSEAPDRSRLTRSPSTRFADGRRIRTRNGPSVDEEAAKRVADLMLGRSPFPNPFPKSPRT